MTYVYNDGGRFAAGYDKDANDCVCRSVAIASGLPYAEVYKVLATGNASQRRTKKTRSKLVRQSADHGVYVQRKWYKDFLWQLQEKRS